MQEVFKMITQIKILNLQLIRYRDFISLLESARRRMLKQFTRESIKD